MFNQNIGENMIKILISVYIVAVLLIAGFAEASVLDSTPLQFDRLSHVQKVWLNVADARFDSRKEILTVSGYVSSECLKTVNSELQMNQKTNEILVSVTAQGENCLANTNNHYEIVIDLKAFFTENSLRQDSMVHFSIDNYTAGDNYSFNYIAKKQTKYSFDTSAEGQVEIDLRTGKFYLVNETSKIEILSRFDMNNYVNSFVQIKGLIPNIPSIGEDTTPIDPQMFVGELTAIR
jgi:hypothetical protein